MVKLSLQGVHARASRGGDSQASKPSETVLTLENVGRTHDGQTQLFSDITLSIKRGQRLAVVGPNGCGKTSLLKLIAGVDEPDSGAIRCRGTRIGYLPQTPGLDEERSAIDAVLHSDSLLARCVRQYEGAMASKDQKALDEAIIQMDYLGGWEFRDRAEQMLAQVGLQDSTQVVRSMSGGQKRRVALAAALLARPDLFVADEPTNHMDYQAIRFMEEQFSTKNTSLVVVTHDRAFMEAVCTSVLEIENGEAHFHSFGGPGSYARFRQIREERRAAMASAAAAARNVLRKESEWMRRQPKARSVKAAARVRQFYELTAAARDVPRAETRVDFEGDVGMKRQGKKVLELKGASCVYDGRAVIRDFWYEFYPGERLGVVGPNGAGKSTLLNLVAGSMGGPGSGSEDSLPGASNLTSGRRDVGETTQIGFFTQEPVVIPEDMTMTAYLRDIGSRQGSTAAQTEDSTAETPANILDRLGFPRFRHYTQVKYLSGGEKRRLQLAAVLIARPNLLILDEPTNDLDLATIESLEGFLAGYSGCLLVASHDRAFMDGLDRLLVLQGDGLVRLFEGSYSEYLDVLRSAEDEAAAAAAAAEKQKSAPVAAAGSLEPSNGNSRPARNASKKPQKRLQLGFREKQEFAALEGEIDQLTERKDELQSKLDAAGGDYTRVSELSDDLAKILEQIEKKTDRWLELAEIADLASMA